MAEREFLAKWRVESYNSTDWGWAIGHTYKGHMARVLAGWNFLASEPYQDSESFLRCLYDTMDLEPLLVEDFPSEKDPYGFFLKLTYLAALTHDLGKSGGEFQHMLHTKEQAYQDNRSLGYAALKAATDAAQHKQAYRHEYLSAILMSKHPAIRGWVKGLVGEMGLWYVIGGAFGHHRKTSEKRCQGSIDGIKDKAGQRVPYVDRPIILGRLSKDMHSLSHIKLKHKPVDLSTFPTLNDTTWCGLTGQPQAKFLNTDMVVSPRADLDLDFEEVLDGMSKNGRDRLMMAVQWITILADVYGSINVGQKNLFDWLRDSCWSKNQYDYRTPILRKLLSIKHDRKNPEMRGRPEVDIEMEEKDIEDLLSSLKPFQRECRVSDNLLVSLAAGNGKTIAAYLAADTLPSRRLIFTTPTTDAATSAYYDYGNEEDAIKHSREILDKHSRKILGKNNLLVATPGNDNEEHEALQEIARTFRNYNSPVSFCTIDQLLGVMGFSQKAILWLPYILASQIVFDECHSYDSKMTSFYYAFLKAFPKLRTIHMSATLIEARRQELKNHVNDLKVIVDPDTNPNSSEASAPRYRIIWHDSMPDYGLMHQEEKSLWFVNTVGRCQAMADQFTSDVWIYHARFRYMDKIERRDVVLNKFKNEDVCRCLGTQVLQVSLDISARIGITEVCPPYDFIQRIGRVNRSVIHRAKGVAEVHVYMPEDGKPYNMSDNWATLFNSWKNELFLQLTGRAVSQRDLGDAMHCHYLKRRQDYI